MKTLIVLFNAQEYTGTTLHALELSKYLKSKGHTVDVVSYLHSRKIVNVFRENGISLCSARQIQFDGKYDYVYSICHLVLGKLFLKGLDCRKLIIASHSKKGIQEKYPAYSDAASLLVAVSEEVKKCRINGEKFNREVHVMPNFLPDEYVRVGRAFRKDLKKIAVVSNHVPKELVSIQEYLPGIKIDYYGIEGDLYQVITPDVLSDYDVIISIGKTVQYGFGLKIPVYIYDIYGGNGYISTVEKLERESTYNFTGRPACRKLDPQEISSELLEGYESCAQTLDVLQKEAIRRFLLSKNVDRMLELADRGNDFDRDAFMKVRRIRRVLMKEAVEAFLVDMKRRALALLPGLLPD